MKTQLITTLLIPSGFRVVSRKQKSKDGDLYARRGNDEWMPIKYSIGELIGKNFSDDTLVIRPK